MTATHKFPSLVLVDHVEGGHVAELLGHVEAHGQVTLLDAHNFTLAVHKEGRPKQYHIINFDETDSDQCLIIIAPRKFVFNRKRNVHTKKRLIWS